MDATVTTELARADAARATTAPPIECLSFQCADGETLAGTRFRPAGQARATVLFAPAMAVPQTFYAAFATHLAGQGFDCLSFDYRGTGLSLGKQSLRAYRQCNITDHWLKQDYEAAVALARSHQPGKPLLVVGHSLGGQLLPLLPSREQVQAVVHIAVGSGYTQHNTPSLRKRAPFMWHVMFPLLTTVMGYFPGSKLGVIGDLPTGPMAQWKRWCLSPQYIVSGEPGAREAYASARYPILAYTFTDDELLLPEGSRMLHAAYQTIQPDYRETSGAAEGKPRVGHFGFFRADRGAHLWPTVTDWLKAQC
jgi:predicted alpha/beta hydrolase